MDETSWEERQLRARARAAAVGRELKLQATILFGMVGLMWFLELVDMLLLGQRLNLLGLRPRTVAGLWGIILMPFLHGGLAHLVANTVPFLVLGWLVMVRRTADFISVTLVAGLVSGLALWLLGPANSLHIGASGLIFGYLGFLLLRGYFERSASAILLAILVFLLYGSLIFGVLPGMRGVSWQGHLFGFLSGVYAAYLLARR
jgi:membrane associated rhomboid family serine protease